MRPILLGLTALLSLLLTLLILMHKGKGGGLSDMFGGSLTHNAGSSGVAEKNLNRWTVIIGLTRFFSPQARDFNPGSRTSAGRGRMWDMRDDIGREREAE